MYYVYFARRYSAEEMVAECRTREAALTRADEELANGSYNITVVTETGLCLYKPEEDKLLFVDLY